jgi:hypothetical protein
MLLLTPEDVAKMAAHQLELAIAGQDNTDFSMIQNGLQLQKQGLGFPLFLLTLLDNLLKGQRQLTHFTPLLGPAIG